MSRPLRVDTYGNVICEVQRDDMAQGSINTFYPGPLPETTNNRTRVSQISRGW